jgi:hypothetical protein
VHKGNYASCLGAFAYETDRPAAHGDEDARWIPPSVRADRFEYITCFFQLGGWHGSVKMIFLGCCVQMVAAYGLMN